ncbi:MAG: hypothetical protein HeimC2_21390 [Candidatus Heimdallarchaeota archaeon LC_2]|nr:MAG: hypothetical protein HeimC2_21390 [Candidatus Heimdallarchaeota archaeon LC_2]
MSEIVYDELSNKKIELLHDYLDKIMRSMESQYGYVSQVLSDDRGYNFNTLIQMYHMPELNVSISIDKDFNFLEDVNSTLEFYSNQVITLGKPLIINDFNLESNSFTLYNSTIHEDSAWYVIPIHHYDKTVAILGLIGGLYKFNVFYFEMFQPFMILCSELLSNLVIA